MSEWYFWAKSFTPSQKSNGAHLECRSSNNLLHETFTFSLERTNSQKYHVLKMDKGDSSLSTMVQIQVHSLSSYIAKCI